MGVSSSKNYKKNTIILLTDAIKSAAYSNINFTSSLIRELQINCTFRRNQTNLELKKQLLLRQVRLDRPPVV